MALSRYFRTFSGKNQIGQSYISTSNASYRINRAVESGIIDVHVHVLEQGERLDHLSGMFYGDSSYWWVIAAASGIGWGLQIPPGTFIKIPKSINDVFGVLS